MASSSSRTSNVCNAADTAQLLIVNCTSLGEGFRKIDYALVVAEYVNFLFALLAKNLRVSKTILELAAMKAFESTVATDAKSFNRQLQTALAECRVKSESMTLGRKRIPV